MAHALIRVRLTPRASRSRIDRVMSGTVHARVSAPPVDGAANAALVELLADALGIRKSAVSIKAGASSRDKMVEAEGISESEALARLETKAAGHAS